MLNGKRDGYGIVYCLNDSRCLLLYECEWKQGVSIQGRYIMIYCGNTWGKYEGQLSSEYLLNGDGCFQDEDGYQYQGQYKQGFPDGQGKQNMPNGECYEGAWQDDRQHRQGRFTHADGSYHEGEWKNSYKVGVHKYYSKEGVFIKEQEYVHDDEDQ
ncbi:hypothetical protein FGO68_gene631 [Halteria grandinella]|uniref:MORN repeat protein n=1 Tax=Halteria grandinella TaxID=5974 RepID=A0A8J8NW82_HALGN|nr:hypothetical protein FGO68_gene631 [Halteria grandinella]